MLVKKIFLPAVVAIFFLMSCGIYFFSYKPAESEILRIQLETRKLQAVEKELADFWRNKNPEDFVERTEENLFAARENLPEEISSDKFIEKIYSSANLNKVQIISVQAGEVSLVNAEEKNPSAEIQKQIITVKLAANYISLMNFIREIYDGERLANLENFSVSAENSGNILDCELHFAIFSVSLKKEKTFDKQT